MAETTALAADLNRERADAIRALLAQPLRHVADDLDVFRLIAQHRDHLSAWFDETCGWALTVDVASGVARLGKRRVDTGPMRPATTGRGRDAPFDRRRYEFLCLIAAEFVNRSMTTTGMLAEAVAAHTDFQTERHRDRTAFVDALRTLIRWRAVTVENGDVESFVHEETANALLSADSTVLHRLLVPSVSPSRLPTGDAAEAVAALARPIATSDDGMDRDEHNRMVRQSLARRLLDDPVVHLDECSDAEQAYLASGAGRQWLRDRIVAAGLELEERADGILAVDVTATTTDVVFPAPAGNVHQMALLLVDEFVVVDPTLGHRVPTTRTFDHIAAAVRDRLAAHPRWAKTYRDLGGDERLATEALELLASVGLVRNQGDDRWQALGAICRYRVATGESGTLL